MAKSTFLWDKMSILFNENTLIKLLYKNKNSFNAKVERIQIKLYPEHWLNEAKKIVMNGKSG